MSFLLSVIRPYVRSLVRPRPFPRFLIAAGLGLLVISAFSIEMTVYAEPMPSHPVKPLQQDTAAGKAIFEEKCTGCHTIGGGKLVGPDLKDITKTRDLTWIKNFILDPAKMIASDADAQQLYKEYGNFTMPTLGLTSDQVNQVVAYLSNPGDTTAAPAPAAPSGVGDPVAGRQIFMGEMHLTNGGPACMSCHTVGGVGVLGGGGLGPDLTQVIQRFGEPGLAAALKTLPFPTMMGPFLNHQLTADEQADLLAFFKDANQSQGAVPVTVPGALTSHVLWFFGIGLGIVAVLFGILWLIWIPLKKRYQPRLPVRKVSRN